MKLDLKSIHFLTQYNFVGDPMQVQIQAPNPALLFPILVHILHYQQGVVGCLSLWCTQQNNKKKKLHFKKPAEGAQPFFSQNLHISKTTNQDILLWLGSTSNHARWRTSGELNLMSCKFHRSHIQGWFIHIHAWVL
jgi:hypothetical protein